MLRIGISGLPPADATPGGNGASVAFLIARRLFARVNRQEMNVCPFQMSRLWEYVPQLADEDATALLLTAHDFYIKLLDELPAARHT